MSQKAAFRKTSLQAALLFSIWKVEALPSVGINFVHACLLVKVSIPAHGRVVRTAIAVSSQLWSRKLVSQMIALVQAMCHTVRGFTDPPWWWPSLLERSWSKADEEEWKLRFASLRALAVPIWGVAGAVGGLWLNRSAKGTNAPASRSLFAKVHLNALSVLI